MKPTFLPERIGLAAFFAVAAPLSGALLAQTTEGPDPGRVRAVERDGPEVALVDPGIRPGIDAGEPVLVTRPTGHAPLPLPVRARYVAGPDGDVLEAPAEGDPYFLGFAGGDFRPPAGERVDPALVDRLVAGFDDGRGGDETYAYAMLGVAASETVKAELEGAGARVLGFRPHQAFSIAVDEASLPALLALDSVHWIGPARGWQKLHPRLPQAFQELAPGERAPLIVSLFETDLGAASVFETVAPTEVAGPGVRRVEAAAGRRWRSEGWQQRALQQLDIEVVEYLPSIHAFRVRMGAEQLTAAAARDFVEFIEPEMPSLPMHDDSQPMIGVDYTRATYDGDWSGEAIGGQIDSGMDIAHTGLDNGWYLGWSFTGQGAWTDNCGHGTHVAGSTLARPHAALAELAGGVPRLGSQLSRAFRNVKFMEPNPNPNGNPCIGAGGSSLENRFSLMRDTWVDGQTSVPKPHFVNNSWGTGATPGGWDGTEANSRAVDAEVWNENQVYLFAAGNSGPGASTLSQEASAKNAITVGNVVPYDSVTVGQPGSLWTSSSIGPVGDTRWKPNVVAPGRNIVSVDANTGSGYVSGSGTSMASPHVAGVVGQMVDRNDFLRYAPARVASLLMATAHTKGGVLISTPASTHLDTYGAGRVDALRAVHTDNQHSWANWGYTHGASQNATGDFTVGVGAQRLAVVMHYIEPAASGGASNALVNDFDLVLDEAPFSANIEDGDWLAQQSNRNNTEIRIIDNPKVGAWRWKIHPVAASSSVRMSVTVHVIYGNPTPNPTLSLVADDVFVKPNETVELTATVTNPSHVASAVYVDTTSTSNATLLTSEMTLKDGLVADLTDNVANSNGFDATLGNIRFGSSRAVEWTARWATQGVKTWSVNAISDNGMNRFASVNVTVDGTPPGKATNLQSSSHFPNVWYAANDLHMVWGAAPDNLSGIAGYSRSVTSSPSLPPASMTLGPVTLTTANDLSSHATGWYFNLRAVDKSGNWSSDYASAGPYLIDTIAPGTASGVVSTSHLTSTWSNDPVVTVKWLHAPDAHSGIGGYGVFWSSANPGQPTTVQDLGVVTTTQSTPFGSSNSARWFNLRAVDAVGNWSANYASAGPFLIDVTKPKVSDVWVASEVGPLTETTSTQVVVVIEANDAHSGLGSMRLRNDAGNWSPWMPFASAVNWNLTAHGGSTDTGTRRIEVEVRDVAGNVTPGNTLVYYYRPHWEFGPAGVGSLGAPTIALDGIVGLGQQFQVSVGNTDAPWKRLILGGSTSWNGFPLPLDLGFAGAPGNTLLVSPDLVLADGGLASAQFVTPLDGSLEGAILNLQWLLFGDPSGATVVTTRAIGFEVNGS